MLTNMCRIQFFVFLTAFVNFGCQISVNSEIIFLATTSKVVRPFSVQKVYISGEESGSATKCSVRITHYNSTKSLAEENLMIEPGKTVVASLSVQELPFHAYNLTIHTEGSLEHKDRAILYVDRNGHTIFIQTDKPIYKPGETVQFRVILLDRELRPSLKTNPKVNISISDTSKNLIKFWKDIEIGDNGLLRKSIELSSEPNLGDWEIKVELNGEKSEHTFNVAQYVLPTFKVEVKLPNFITFNDSKLIAEVSAMYTYGKLVNKGEFQVSLEEYLQYCTYCTNPKKTKTVSLNGGPSFVEFDVKKDLNITDPYENEYKISAVFTESVTGLQQNGSATIHMYRYPYKVSLLNQPSNYKPGFPLNLTVQVSTQDNIPISDDDPNALQISHGFSWEDENGHLNSSIPKDGLVHLNFKTPSNEYITINTMQIKYKELTQDIYLPDKFITPNKIYMQLYRLTNDKIKSNDLLQMRVKLNKAIGAMKYILLCRGQVSVLDKLPISEPISEKMEQDFSIKIPSNCNPQGRLIVYGISYPKNDIVADSVTFDMETTLDNFLNISISNTTVEPRSNISLSMESKPKSTIALRGVDQSVLLLKKDSDLDIKAVEEVIKSSGSVASQYNMWGGSNIFRIFDEGGIVLLSNAKIDKPLAPMEIEYAEDEEADFESSHSYGVGRMSGGGMGGHSTPASMKMASPVMLASSSISSENVMIRTEFPETWIFDEINSTQDGIATFSQTVPDTITSWIITGFSINGDDGLGVGLNPVKLTTFRPFFISVNVPYSVVTGEVFALQVLVHNYMDMELKVDVIVDNPSGLFNYLENKDSKQTENFTKTITVGPSQVLGVSFLVTPTVFGIKKLKVKGVSAVAGDGISRPLIVKPPGQKQLKNSAVLIDLRSGEKLFKTNLTAEFPDSRVVGADDIRLTLIGDMIGSTVSHLDKLLHMPTGCGEQNMLNFVVDIVVLNYLKSTGGLTPEIRRKALGYLEKGYQRQLTYLRSDGSFSAFGNSDEFGSTWLTAFVIRSFIQAMPFITIDENIINLSLQYLAERQQPYGGFEELGRVHDEELLGGSASGGLAMSSYTLLAFLEASKSVSNFNYSSNVTNGLNYISGKIDVSNNTYAINLIAYTLQVADHPEKEKFYNALESIAKQDGDLKHWEQKINTTKNSTDKYYHYFPFWIRETQPATVEMTAYALLTTLMANKITESLPIARWLTTQRNDNGGFKSTQDTVVGITALAKFGLATRTKDSDLNVKFEYVGQEKELKISNNNEMEVQEIELPADASSVQLTATGKGSALAQLTWSYYVEGKNSSPAFDLTVKSKDTGNPKKLELSICGAYKYSEKSNMVLMEVELPTGYTFVRERLDEIKNNQVLRYETEDSDTKLIIYFNQMTSEVVCVDLYGFLTHPVAKQAPAHVVLYDYYDTTKQATASYDAPKISICDICQYDKTCEIANCV